jgi:outer membrane protein assembly factor BamA
MDNDLNTHSQKFTHFQIELTKLLALFIYLLLSSSVFANNIATKDNFNPLIVDGLVCRGNDATECSFITKKYYQNVGDVVDPDEIADARLRLGTLQQFRSVSIVLEKASQRGRVNVVFIVNEANNIQYRLNGNYRHFDGPFFKDNIYGLNAGVTNFNFLGTGKQLSFDVFSSHLNTSYDKKVSSYFGDGWNSKNNNLRLEYYDPHLSGSVNYYFTAGLLHSQTKQKAAMHTEGANDNLINLDIKSYRYNLSLGRRFGSHSYAAVHATGTKFVGDLVGINDDSFSPRFSVEYGWDSRDDLIFPTRGSSFSMLVDESVFDGDYTVTDANGNSFIIENQTNAAVKYSNNIGLNSELIFNYDIEAQIDLKKLDELDRQPFPTISLGLTNVDSTHSTTGQYRGWKYGVSLPINPNDLNISYPSFSIEYIYQTDALIVNLSLSYSADIKDVF